MALTAEQKNALMSKDREVLTTLFESALTSNWEKLRSSVESYARDNDKTPFTVLTEFRDGQRRTVLHFACQAQPSEEGKEDVDIVKRILNKDWIPNESAKQKILKQKDKAGLTPLMLCAQQKRDVAEKRVAHILEFAGPDLKLGLARSQVGATALHYAAGAGATPTTLEALCGAGKVALSTFSNKGGTPLHWAAVQTFDCTETIGALLKLGASPDPKLPEGSTSAAIHSPLVLAIAASNDKHAQRLLECENISIDMNLPGDITLFHMAAGTNMMGALSALLERKQKMDKLSTDAADYRDLNQFLDQKNEEGLTPIELAAREGHAEPVLLLLRHKGGSSLTEADAKAYIEKVKAEIKNKPKEGKSEQTAQSQSDDPSKKAPTEPEDENEADAVRHARAIAEGPDVSESDQKLAIEHKTKGNKHFMAKEWNEALSWYAKAISVNPKEAALYSNSSACYNNLEDYDKSLWNGIVARTLRPFWSKGYYRVAVARLALKRYEDAAVAAFEGLEQDEQNDELRSLLQKAVKEGRKEHLQKKKESGDDEE